MMRKTAASIAILAFVLPLAAAAMPGAPDFSGGIWADGRLWGTKAAAMLRGPNMRNEQSFDKLYVITNSNNPEGQLPVAEAAPGDRNYNGGRWYTQTVEWTQAGFDFHGTVPVLKSYDDIQTHYNLGHLTITPGSPPGGPPEFFECPLLPVK
ncbi:MAG: hypothetical protein P8181_11845 [bacterium]